MKKVFKVIPRYVLGVFSLIPVAAFFVAAVYMFVNDMKIQSACRAACGETTYVPPEQTKLLACCERSSWEAEAVCRVSDSFAEVKRVSTK